MTCPIIEPVKSSFNGLYKSIETLLSNEMKFAIVLNPNNGDFKRDSKDIIDNVELLQSSRNWIPAFICRENEAKIYSYIREKKLTNVMIIISDSYDLSNINLIELLQSEDISYIVAKVTDDRRNKRKLLELGKKIIRLDDKFKEQIKNADYLDIPEEKFTEEHQYYKEDGFYGFSDYTTLSSSFKDSGMLPYAVAIHMTYNKTEDEVYVRHFVSDHIYGTANIQGKFFEAATKMKDFYRSVPQTIASSTLIDFLDSNRYPGLGIIKKLSIKNHLELIENFLENKQRL